MDSQLVLFPSNRLIWQKYPKLSQNLQMEVRILHQLWMLHCKLMIEEYEMIGLVPAPKNLRFLD